MTQSSLPTAADARKGIPLAEGLLYYFPAALAKVAALSKKGNDQHNPGQPMHWARDKSRDHADCIVRHQMDAGTDDTDGEWHSTKVAWRALAQLQLECERREGAPLPRNARLSTPTPTASDVIREVLRPAYLVGVDPASPDAQVDAALPPGTPPLARSES